MKNALFIALAAKSVYTLALLLDWDKKKGSKGRY